MGGQPELDAARQLFAQGRVAELVARSDCRPHAITRLPAAHQLVLAHALVLTGKAIPARTLAVRHTTAAVSQVDRSRAHSVLTLCAQLDGDVPSSLFHAEAAAELAERSGSERRTVWAHLGLLRLQVDAESGPGLESQLARAGALARRSQLAQALAYFHECASIVDGQRGRLASAWRHCASAESLLVQEPSLALQGTLLLNRSCLRYLEGDYEGALVDLQHASTWITHSGLVRNAGALRNNRAHLELLTGRLTTAQRAFGALSRSRKPSRDVRIGALDGLARTHLAAGALDQCDAELDRLQRYAGRADLDAVYHVRWASLTRTRALLARGRVREALDHAHHLEATASRTGDTYLRGIVLLLTARAHHALGQPAEAARELLRAADVLEHAPQLRAEYCHHAAALVADLDPPAARLLRDRAHRLWSAGGASGLRAEVERSEVPVPPARRATEPVAGSPLAVALAAAACVDTAGVPNDLPRALAALARALGLDADDALDSSIPADPAAALAQSSLRVIARAARPAAVTDDKAPPRTGNGDVERETSTEMDTLRSMARRIASTDTPVLITGETGTGKDLLARFIHQHSASAAGPFVPFNCAAVGRDLFDSQLFGHRKGAFTGAGEDALGVIRAAAGGTLFLDEIGEMGLDTQPKLLRFLESGEVHPVGATRADTVHVRVVAATNADLEAMVADRRFREDLYYRLGIVRFRLPPLRERRPEILPLAQRFLQEFATRYGKGTLTLDDSTAACLSGYGWPGNIRQLLNEMKRVAALADSGTVIETDALSPEIRRRLQRSDADSAPAEVTAIVLAQPVRTAVESLERAQVAHALRACAGHAGQAAELLGLSRKGLYLKRRRYGL